MELEFAGRRLKPDVRWLYDMRDVVFDRDWAARSENIELYYMYRDLSLSRADRLRLQEQGIRYDVTIIPPRMLGPEYVKTAGHYHPVAQGSTTFPELYEVLEGEAIYLLQRQDLQDVVAVRAEASDKVLVPPGYGHITINPSKRTLKMANLVASGFSSLYEPIRERRGGAYFLTTDGWVRNVLCPEAVALREAGPLGGSALRRLGLSRGREIYSLIRERGRLGYLTTPQDHLELFKGLI